MARTIGYRQWGIAREMRAGSGAGLVTAVGTITEVIIDSREWDLDGGVGDTSEGFRVLVELGNYKRK